MLGEIFMDLQNQKSPETTSMFSLTEYLINQRLVKPYDGGKKEGWSLDELNDLLETLDDCEKIKCKI